MKRRRLRLTALITAVLMCITIIPSAVFAEGETEGDHVHTMEFVEKVEATCKNSGVEAHYYCSGCDNLFAADDAEGKTPVEGVDLIIPIKPHDWDNGKVERKATAKQKGIYTYTCKNCGAKRSEEYDYIEPPIKAASAKKFSLNGYKLQFKEPVAKKAQPFLAKARVDHVWVKAAKSKITVYWKVNNGMKVADSILIMRKTGKSSVYKQIAEVSLFKTNKGVRTWAPKSSYVDKTAKKKNTAYSYIAIAKYDEDLNTYISNCSDWAAAQTSASKLKNTYKAKLNKKSLSLQYKGTAALKATISKPKKKFGGSSVRWYSDNKKVAKVSSKGKVTATGVGRTTIRARLRSGKDVTCKVSVVGAFKPGTPKLQVDVASKSSITLIWTKVKFANAYNLYQSNDGLHWKAPIKVKGTAKKVTGLKKGHRYTFYVVARNDNHGYTALSTNSNVVNQKAVIKRRPTAVTGFPLSKTLYAGQSLVVSLKITSPDGRRASLQKLNGKKWITQKTVTLPKGAGKTAVKILFPNTWWGITSTWRLVIPRNNTSEEYISKNLTIKSVRVYQNPKAYVQISDTISKHGYSYYTSKVLVNSASTRANHVEALITTANKYLGDTYINGGTGAPGKGIDAPGLVIQACYGAGVDLWPIGPAFRPMDCSKRIYEGSKLRHIAYAEPVGDNYPNFLRGDLIFFYTGKTYIGHVAIYLGWGKIIHASQVTGKVETSTIKKLVSKKGKYKYKIAEARRIFN